MDLRISRRTPVCIKAGSRFQVSGRNAVEVPRWPRDYRFQVSGSKHQIPSTKHQAPSYNKQFQITNQPINQSTNQPINQSTNQPINQSTNHQVANTWKQTKNNPAVPAAVGIPSGPTTTTGQPAPLTNYTSTATTDFLGLPIAQGGPYIPR